MKHGIALSLAYLFSAPAFAATPAQPIKPWVVDYDDTKCSASRIYGSVQQPTVLAFRPSPRGNVIQLILARPGKSPAAYHLKATAQFGETSIESTALRFSSSNKASEVIWMNFDSVALAKLPEAKYIALRVGSVIDESFAIPGIDAVLKALQACTTDLQAHWNASDEANSQFKIPAKAHKPLARYFSSSDYPSQAVAEGATGMSRVTLMVDETGKVADCMVEQTSGIATLDAMTCAVLTQRAKFDPARDATDRPVRSVCSVAIRWVTE